MSRYTKPRSVITKMDSSAFKELVCRSRSYSEILNFFGLSMRGGGALLTLKKRINIEGITTDHFKKEQLDIKKTKYSDLLDSDMFSDNSKIDNAVLRRRILKKGILEYVCAICGLGPEWCGKPLTLPLDHINGNPKDNRISNLRFLCLNCHGQTDTYGSKNRKVLREAIFCEDCNQEISYLSKRCRKCSAKKRHRDFKESTNRPSIELLQELLKEKTYKELGRFYNVSGNTIKKWAYGIQSTAPVRRRASGTVVFLNCSSCGLATKHTKGDNVLCRKCSLIKRRKVTRPELSILTAEINKFGLAKVSRKYGITPSSLKKWFTSIGLEVPRK